VELTSADATTYDVYTHVAEFHLANVGIDVKWSDVDVGEQRHRWGNSRKYFTVPTYRLPVCSRQ
jgi:protein arginine N-methyltransferase 2